MLGALVLLAATPGSAEVPGASAFSGTAAARLVAVDVRVTPTVVFDPLLDGGQSVAQAQLDSLGISQAFASSVYPGAAVIALPGLLGTVTNGQIGSDNVPPYPLYVDSAHPLRPSSRQQVGVYELSAQSEAHDSRAKATDGATEAAARVFLESSTGDVVARAESTVGALRISDELSLLGIRSFAEVRQSPSGELQRRSEFGVAALSVLGHQLSLGGDGLAVLDQRVPLDGLLEQLLAPVLAGLREEGVTIEVVPGENLDDGVQAAGLRITTTVATPASLASGLQSAATVITLGGNVASVSNEAIPAFSAGPDVATAPATNTSGPASSGLGSDPATQSSVLPSPVEAPAGGAGTGAAAAPAAPIASTAAVIPNAGSVAGFYPVLLLAGVAVFAAARLFPPVGRRSS